MPRGHAVGQDVLLLIGGHVRSGTTLVRELCGGHPEMAITNEFRCFCAMGVSYPHHSRRVLREQWRRARRREPGVRNRLRFAVRYLYHLRRHRSRYASDGTVNGAAIYATFKSLFPGTRIVGDKTPAYVFALDELVLIDNAAFLIVLRDCRDVVSSTLERMRAKWHKEWGHHAGTAEQIALRWLRSVDAMERHAAHLHVLRYEDLIGDPARELQRLGDWIGVNPAGFLVNRIRSTSVGKYKSGLTKEELETVMDLAGPTMARLGYR